jgi:hypothetical protein
MKVTLNVLSFELFVNIFILKRKKKLKGKEKSIIKQILITVKES